MRKKIEEREGYLSEFKEKFKLEHLLKDIESLKNLKVMCIGDIVIDRYIFVNPKGRASKDPILSTQFASEERYAGGVLAVVNHLSSYVNGVKLVSLIGDKRPQRGFIEQSLFRNIKPKLFVKPNSPTTDKVRYLDSYHKGIKLFKMEYLDDKPISRNLSNKIMNCLLEELPKHDLVIVLDYDHGFMNKEIRNLIQEKSKFLSLNCQVNSANYGYHYIDSYEKADFITVNDTEIRLPMRMRGEPIEKVLDKFYERHKYPKILLTTGKRGCVFLNEGKKYSAPTLTAKILDTIGAGDAVFAITSLFAYSKVDNEKIPFFANCAGGIDANILGNKEFVDKNRLLPFIKNLYSGAENGLGNL